MKKITSAAKESGVVKSQVTVSADNNAPEVTTTGKETGKEKESLIDHCQKHMHRFVRVQTHDGVIYQAVVESVDQNYISLAVPTCTHTEPMQANANIPVGNPVPNMGMERAYHPQPYPYPGTPYPGTPYPGTPYPGTPFPGTSYPGMSYPGMSYPGTPYMRPPFIDQYFPGYSPGYYYPYGYGRRFGRVVLPLAGLAALSLTPYY